MALCRLLTAMLLQKTTMALDSHYEIEYQSETGVLFALLTQAAGFLTLTLLDKLSFQRRQQQARVVTCKDRSEGALKTAKRICYGDTSRTENKGRHF